jgi:3-oxoadipate enol-lactonase
MKEQAEEIQRGSLDVGGSSLFFEARGDGEVVVLIHDGLFHREVWDAQWNAFAGQYKVVKYDRRGYGCSAPPTQTYSDVEDLEALFGHLNISRATLIGASAGSNIALEYVLARPETIERLILVGPVVAGLDFTDHFKSRSMACFKPLMEDGDVGQTMENWLKDPYLIASVNEAARSRARELLTANPQNITHPFNLSRPFDPPTLHRLGEIRVPTLIIASDSDIADVHAHSGAIQAGIQGSKRMIIAGAGHLPYIERPEEFNSIVLEFLASAA